MVGAKFLVSVPNVIVRSVSQDTPQILGDQLFTAAAVLRLPLFNSNYALVATASTNGRFSFGISLLNFSFLPFLP
jgi:hypothetical protein